MKQWIYLQIVKEIKEDIYKGKLLDGFVLPSERQMAKEKGVHRNTISRVYGELKAQGLVASNQGKNYVVTYKSHGTEDKGKAVNWDVSIKDEYLDLEHVFDEIFAASYKTGAISFAGGIPSPSIYKEDDIASGFKEVLLKRKESSYFYTPYQGDKSLRKNISQFFKKKGILATPGNIQIFSETNQALDFLVTLLLNKGDTVIIEDPVSPDVYRPLELSGAKIISVPVDQEGMVCDYLEPILEKEQPKFIYVNSSYHDPTGKFLSLSRRKKLLELSYKYRVPIIEEDSCSELYYGEEKTPSLKAMDKGDNVIYLYSFSMTFLPGVGIACLTAPKKLIKSLSYLVSVRLISLDWMAQKLLDVSFETGDYYNKLEEFRKTYKNKRDKMCQWLDTLKPLGISYEKPEGGVYIWCQLPSHMDGETVVKEGRKKGVSMIPGDIFFPKKDSGGHYLRLNFSYPEEEQIDQGMEKVKEILLAQCKKQ